MIKQKNKTFFIAIDIGNTNIHIGIFLGSSIVKRLRINTYASRPAIYKALKKSLICYKSHATKAIISSVVPCTVNKIKNTIKNILGIEPLVLGKDLQVPIKNLYDRPGQVGHDRLVNAYACKELYGVPAIVIDFGTATTFDYLNKKGQYEGGIITPGINITLDALAEKTALLPKINLKKPKKLIGKDTKDSMRSGVINGLTCMCDGLVEKIIKERKIQPIVIATGGLADIFCPYSMHINKIDKDLTLKGLFLIFSKKIRIPLVI
jgi:type III pantothenate kinase